MNSESEQSLKEKEIQHRIDNLKLPIKDRKPFERTELQKLQFQKCTEALKEKNRLKKEMKNSAAPTNVEPANSSAEESAADVAESSSNVKAEEQVKSERKRDVKKRRVVFEDHSDSDESEEEDLLQYVIKKKKPQKRKRKVVYLQDSSEDEEEEVFVKRRPRQSYEQEPVQDMRYAQSSAAPAFAPRPTPSFRYV